MWGLILKHKLAAAAAGGAIALLLADLWKRKRNSNQDQPGSSIGIDVGDAFGRHAGAADPDAFDW